MRKQSEENASQQATGWERGSMLHKKKDSSNEENLFGSQKQNQNIKFIPKPKDRNPQQALQQLSNKAGLQQEQANAEIKTLIKQFNHQAFHFLDFLTQAIQMMDISCYSNQDIIEFTLGQSRQKDYFKEQPKMAVSKIIQALLNSLECNKSFGNREACVKMLGQICFDVQDIEASALKKLYQNMQKLAFTKQEFLIGDKVSQVAYVGGSGSSSIISAQQESQKVQRLSINCIANLLMKQSAFIKENNDYIFASLKFVLDQHMLKVKSSYKSKRFVSSLTTTLRALSFSMVEGSKLKLPDTDAVKLFLHFYKLLFLGTPFSEKMLQISIQEAQKLKSEAKEEEELKSDSGSIVIDTSDISSSDGGNIVQSPKNKDDLQLIDPYQKVKMHSMTCLQYLFVNNNKALFNYWYLMFPSFMLKPQSDFTIYLQQLDQKQQEFFNKVEVEFVREPSLFYLLQQKETNIKMKQGICQVMRNLFEYSHVSKWQMALEKKSEEQQVSQFISMSNSLGQFQRFMHYNIIYLLNKHYSSTHTNESSPMLVQVVKLAGTVIQVTPYSKMLSGLCYQLVNPLLSLLTNRSITSSILKISILNTLALAFSSSDLTQELLPLLICPQSFLAFILDEKGLDSIIKYSPEAFLLIQRIAKVYPESLDILWDSHLLTFLNNLNASQDKRKLIQMLKIVEEWLLTYRSVNDQGEDRDDEEEEGSAKKVKEEQKQDGPFGKVSFQVFMADITTKMLSINRQQLKLHDTLDKQLEGGAVASKLKQQTASNVQFNREPHSDLEFKPDSELKIAIMTVLQNLDSEQWLQLFSKVTVSSQPFVQVIIGKISEINGPPAVLKAAALKFFGYIVQQDLFRQDQALIHKLFTLSFESANETNTNVQIRNSWLLANLCYIVISDGGNFTEDTYLLQEVLRSSINYAYNNKEKVIANALRALGYLLGSIDYVKFQVSGLKTINSSQLYLSKLNPKVLSPEKSLELSSVFSVMLGYLNNKNPKISWNACVALGKVLTNTSISSLIELELLASAQTISTLFDIVVFKQNFKVRIHAMHALLKMPRFPEQQMKEIWEFMQKLLQGLNSLYYLQSPVEQKYANQIESQAMQLWAHLASNHMPTQSHIFEEFLSDYAVSLLQDVCQFLRKQLRVPLHSMLMNDKQAVELETQQIFQEMPELEEKLKNLQLVVTKIRDTLKESEVGVSFSVFDGFDQLAKNDVRKFRDLEVLRTKKSSFEPSFDDKK